GFVHPWFGRAAQALVHGRLSAGHRAGLQYVWRRRAVATRFSARTAMASIDETRSFIPLNIAVLTISDTRALADDKSGATLSDRLPPARPHPGGRAHLTHARAGET